MPINEASGLPVHSHLTREQKRQAEAAMLGLSTNNHEGNMDINDLTPQEIERMREIVLQHDRTSGKAKEFDLNNPPQEPRVYAEFPRMIYHHGKRIYKVVQNEQQLEEHLADGWNKTPYAMDEPAPTVQLSPANAAEAEEVNKKLAELRKKK